MIATTFASSGQRVHGMFHPSRSGPAATTVLLLHGFPGNERDVLGLGEALAHRGVQTLTFNYRGTYRSEGLFSLAAALVDIAAAWEHLHGGALPGTVGIDPARTVLGGFSFGGGMALTYAERHPEVRRVFSVAGTDHGAFARSYLRDADFRDAIDRTFAGLAAPTGPVRFDATDSVAPHELIDDPDPYDLVLSTPRLVDRDLLLIGGWDDDSNTIEENLLPLYRSLVRAGAERVRVEALQDDHAFVATRAPLAELVADWLESGA